MQEAAGQPPSAAGPRDLQPEPTVGPQPALPVLAPELAPLAIAAALADSTAVAAALAEAQQKLGCARCRYSRGGCARCRNPSFKPRLVPGSSSRQQQQEQPQPSGDQGSAAAPGVPARRAARGKRQRKASPGQASSGEPLVHALRRQLQSLQTQPSSNGESLPVSQQAGMETLPQPQPAQDAGAPRDGGALPGAAEPAAGAEQPIQRQQQQQQQHQKRAAEASAPGGRPAKFMKADAELVSSLRQGQPPQQQPQREHQPAGRPGGAPTAVGAEGKRGASSEPSPSSRRPCKRQRPHTSPAAGRPPAAATAAPAPGEEPGLAEQPAPPETAAAAEGGGAPKRPASQQQPHRPAKFRRVTRPEGQEQHGQVEPDGQHQQQQRQQQQEQQEQEQQQQEQHQQEQHQQEQRQRQQHQQHQQHQQRAPDSQGSSGEAERMDVDPLGPHKRAAAEAEASGGGGGGAGPQAAPPSPAEFLAKLEERMQVRHQERQSAHGSPAQLALLALGGSKRRKQSPKVSAPAGRSPPAALRPASEASAAAAAAEEEPDPRVCLWEPPASPYGLLEEELFDDPWKLLVACMLLNKTSGAQVRKVIWDLFALCPTPAAAIAVDVQQVQNLVQPLGLFRKRALAIQQLSHDYLYKQWRNPTELFGIGKYAADAYLMFCRGRWREVQPDDKDLKKYQNWLEQTGGLGTGLTRHRTMAPAAAAGTTA
ncbi:hypothetical protein ABPG77_002422 [Micractinium sp. CCAP 211/92]